MQRNCLPQDRLDLCEIRQPRRQAKVAAISARQARPNAGFLIFDQSILGSLVASWG